VSKLTTERRAERGEKRLAKKIMIAVTLSLVIVVGIMAVVGVGYVPDTMYAISGEMPYISRAPYITIRFDDNQAVETAGCSGKTQTARAELLGIIPIKRVNISFVERESVMLGGVPIGIRLGTKGVIVAETTELLTESGYQNPGSECGLAAGDCILRANGEELTGALQLIEMVEQSDGRSLVLLVMKQDGATASLVLKPAFSKTEGCYRAGIWIRNGMSGIGVLTYYDKESGVFGGLGHAVCDETTGRVISVSDGEITSVNLTEIIKGASGAPGELVGFIGDKKYGTLTQNTPAGIYGYIEDDFSSGQAEYQAALKQEIREGTAQIAASVPGSDGIEFFDIRIEKINYDENNPTRNMIVRVTDEKLLSLTGGIVQGMSGSPIIQNGRIVGAVTHVLVNDPTSGYGIFIENMLDMAG